MLHSGKCPKCDRIISSAKTEAVERVRQKRGYEDQLLLPFVSLRFGRGDRLLKLEERDRFCPDDVSVRVKNRRPILIPDINARSLRFRSMAHSCKIGLRERSMAPASTGVFSISKSDSTPCHGVFYSIVSQLY